MIYRITGKIIEKQPSFIAIDVNGVAYEVAVSLHTYSSLPAIDSEVQIYTYMSVKEDGVSLFGFSSIEERQLFLLLITVSGIGPKLALKILGGIGANQFKDAISNSDYDLLSTIPGVGKKTAQRIVVELKDKFKNLPETTISLNSNTKQDVISALVNLGYKQADCIKALESVSNDYSFEDMLKEAFKILSGKN